METNTPQQVSCVSLGLVILDEIRMPNKPPLLNVIGGSATFVTLGLRFFATESSIPGCLVMAGSDFPQKIREEMRGWRTSLVIINSLDHPSSRGLLVYEDNTFGPKTFEYTTPPIRVTPKMLVGMQSARTPLLGARAFHFFGRPEEILAQVPELLQYRQRDYPALPKPFIVWEPLPSSCTPGNQNSFFEACKLVDVFSPNHLELAALFLDDQTHQTHESDTLKRLEDLARIFTDSGISPNGTGAIVVRAGADGALALQRDKPTVRIPAYYEHGSDKMVDPTGAGNAFLGGYIAGWLRESNVMEALCYGAVAASFALEQIGLPNKELVNAEVGERRVGEFKKRLGM